LPDEAWSACLASLKLKLLNQSVESWLRPVECTRFDNHEVVLVAPNSFSASWIKDNYMNAIRKAIRELYKTRPEITLEVSPEDAVAGEQINLWQAPSAPAPSFQQTPAITPTPTPESTTESASRPSTLTLEPPPQELSRHAEPFQAPVTRGRGSLYVGNGSKGANQTGELALNVNFSFDSFVVGPYNEIAYSAAQTIAEIPGGTPFNPLLIYGGVGLGKTHLMQAVAHQCMGGQNRQSVLYVTSEQFAQDYVTSLKEKRTLQFARHYRQVDVLLVDDVQFFQNKERMQEEFFHTFNTLYNQGKQIVLTSDRPPEELGGLQDRLLSRFQSGLVADMQPPELETRVAICQKKAEIAGLELSVEFAEYLASLAQNNVREIERLVKQVLFFVHNMKMPLSMATIEKAVGKRQDTAPQQVTITQVQDAIAKYYRMPLTALTGKSRRSDVVARRQMAMYLCKALTDDSLRTIGNGFGGKNHATVLYSIRRFDQRLQSDNHIQMEVNSVTSTLGVPSLFSEAR
jgi:chromosomal replication initiator protein